MTDMENYILARWAYSVGQPVMSDAEYTFLDQAIRREFPDSPYCSRSWSSDPCPVELLRKEGRTDLIKAVVLSDKTESIPTLNTLYAVKSMYSGMSAPHTVSYKLDGWNIQASYYNGSLVNIQTRGRASDAMDAAALEPLLPQTIPEQGKVLVIMECTIPNSEFQWFKDRFGVTSQRGAVSTALANPKASLSHINLSAHGVRCQSEVKDKFALLKSWGFQVPMYGWVSDYYALMKQIEAFSDYREKYGLPTDGVVVEGEEARAVRIMSWEEPIYQSFVTGYEESYGPHSISMLIDIYPIRLPNSVQRVLPATNVSRVISLNLRPGYPVAFRIASSAIADIDENATRLLQKQWEGRESAYRTGVKYNEALK